MEKWGILLVGRIDFAQLFEYPYFSLAGIPVFGDRADNLDGDPRIGLCVNGLNDLAEGAFTQLFYCSI